MTFVGPVPPITGGIASHAAYVVRAFEAAGADVQVVSWSAQYPRRLFRGSGIDPASAALPGARYLLRWWDPISWVRAGWIARKGDLLVMPWVTPVHAIPEWVMSAVSGVPLSLVVHNAVPHERMPADKLLARWVMRRAAHIVVHAKTVAEQVHELAPAVPVTVLPMPPLLPVDVGPMPPAPPLRLLCLGFIRPYKGFDVAVDAVRRLRARGVDVHLTIAGEMWDDGDEWNAPRRRSRDRAGAVTTHRRATCPMRSHALARLASHTARAVPRSATQSGVVPLAFAAGRPVVATDVGGLPDVVAEG